jgi:hypothetical protein
MALREGRNRFFGQWRNGVAEATMTWTLSVKFLDRASQLLREVHVDKRHLGLSAVTTSLPLVLQK